MNSKENSVNGLVHEKPGTSTFNWEEMKPSPSSSSDHNQQLSNIQAPDSELWDRLWCTNSLQCDPFLWSLPPELSEQDYLSLPPPELLGQENLTSLLPELLEQENVRLPPQLLEQDNVSEDGNHSDGTFSTFSSQVGTEHDDASPGSFFTYPSVSSTPEQGDEAEGLVPAEGATVVKSVFSLTGISVDITAATLGVPVFLPANLNLSIPGSAGCVWSDSACHEHDPRLAPSEDEMKKLFKGVMKKKGSHKWTSEIRFAEKLVKVSKLKTGKKKVWLGTFDTRVQAARAVQVGRFLLSEKKKLQYPAHFEQPFKSILSELKKHLRAQPIDAEVENKVKILAKEYSQAGSNCELCFYSVNNN